MKIIFAAKGWKSLKEDYIARDLHTMHIQKLHTLLQQDVSGYSFEEMIIHYAAISFSALYAAVAGYMQAGTLENAEAYFYLASMAKQTSGGLLTANPRKQIQRGWEVPLDSLTAAVLCGCIPAAAGMLETTRMTLAYEQKQPGRSRKDQQQNERRKQRISLETTFYENLLNGNDEQARRLLPELEGLQADALQLQVLRAFLERDREPFLEALTQHMKAFRSPPYPGELNYFVLLMEALYQKRDSLDPLDLADAPAALLRLPECSPDRTEEALGIRLPECRPDQLLKVIDPSKTGPKFKQY